MTPPPKKAKTSRPFLSSRERFADKAPERDGEERGERLPKRKVAVLFGYNGKNMSGSQIMPHEQAANVKEGEQVPALKSVEGELMRGLVAAQAISEDNADSVHKVGWGRTARTDKGVHAAVNVVTLKMILNPSEKPEHVRIEDWVNRFLPEQVRVWAVIRVQRAFNARNHCDMRKYEYVMPTSLFLGAAPYTEEKGSSDVQRSGFDESSDEGGGDEGDDVTDFNGGCNAKGGKKEREEGRMEKEGRTEREEGRMEKGDQGGSTAVAQSAPAPPTSSSRGTLAENTPRTAETENFWAEHADARTFEKQKEAREGYRISGEMLARVRAFAEQYVGSHKFHNFTVDKSPRDPSAQRVMRSVTVSEPFIVNTDGKTAEFVSVELVGQSFMLHQIRKMMGLLVLGVRAGAPPSLVSEAYGYDRMIIPKAPAEGLLLCEPVFENYNKRVLQHNETGAPEAIRDVIELSPATLADIDAFKRAYIYTDMWECEVQRNVFSLWLRYLDSSPVEYLSYLYK